MQSRTGSTCRARAQPVTLGCKQARGLLGSLCEPVQLICSELRQRRALSTRFRGMLSATHVEPAAQPSHAGFFTVPSNCWLVL